jgi:hypothetical protein
MDYTQVILSSPSAVNRLAKEKRGRKNLVTNCHKCYHNESETSTKQQEYGPQHLKAL